MPSAPFYALRAAEVFQALDTSPDGLTPEESQARLSLYGPNVLREPAAAPLWRKSIGHLTHLMGLLLLCAGLLAIVIGKPVLGVVIWLVVLINAAFSFWQEYRAEQAVASLKKLLPAYARVIRAGQEIQIPASQVVPGDVLALAEGDNVPADARIVEEYGLRVNNATLTGEAVPARKSADASLREDLTEVERPNLIFAGTSIVSGTGRAAAYATGMLTQFGRIANLTQAVKEEPSLLQRGMARITRIISLFAFGVGAIVFVQGLLDAAIPDFQAFILALGIIVAAVPEGLVPTLTLSLAMAVQRLARRGVLVKKLAVLETLGATSIICTDKSGTLTQNQMTVREVWVGGQRLKVSGTGYEPKGEFSPAPLGTPVRLDLDILLGAALLCNNARLNPPSPERPQWTCLGDQTEAALRALALKGGVNEHTLAATFPRVHELPFDARRKRMSTIHKLPSPKGQIPKEIAFVKGAPKEVLQLCTHILMRGEERPLDERIRAEIMAANDDYARNALRVLALARRELPAREGVYAPETVERGLTFLGLAAMMDPPRPEVVEAVKKIREAGIRIVMITGDYGLTAESLARRVGMFNGRGRAPRILTGAELDEMSDADAQLLFADEVIFARMAPEHKLRLVAAFQAREEVVAVIGDGVNDAPALRKADIGIAMGVTGTDVAKEAADVILTQDNFSAIVSAIEEGRAVYDNLRKFITYIFASNVPEIVPFILTALFNIPLALNVAQILLIDLGTDLLPALALGAEKPEPNVMRRPPRRRGQPLLDGGLLARAFLWLGVIETALCYAGFFLVYYLSGYGDPANLPRTDWLSFAERLARPEGRVYILATTVFYAGVVIAQIGNAFTCRTEKEKVHHLGFFSNRFLLIGVAVALILLGAQIYFPPLAVVFEHRPLPPLYWVGLGLYVPILYGLDRIRKSFARRVERERLDSSPNSRLVSAAKEL
ncbi:MAG: cation-transporting P-type ATPase [Chloroflexi bacterium]|nr:cation-transporting P-type ATPase [Chloroflexota bacterium]